MKTTFLSLVFMLVVGGCSREISIKDAYVKFFENPDYGGQALTVVYTSGGSQIVARGDVRDFSDVVPDDQQDGNFNDKASSVVYLLPKGWAVVVFEHANYDGSQLRLVGTGKIQKISDLSSTHPPFDHKISSLRWIPK